MEYLKHTLPVFDLTIIIIGRFFSFSFLIFLFIYLFIYLFICLFIYLFIYLFVYLFIWGGLNGTAEKIELKMKQLEKIIPRKIMYVNKSR